MITYTWLEGSRDPLAGLFAEADDSQTAIAGYRDDGDVLVARHGSEIVGHAQLLEGGDGELELKSLAVLAPYRRRGVGRALVERAAEEARARGCEPLVLATGTADVELLRYYQRLGFRLTRIEPDAFTPEQGYPPLEIDGIPLRDRVWLSSAVTAG